MLRNAIMERRAVAVPGAYDALSAKVMEMCAYRGHPGVGLWGGRLAFGQAGCGPSADEGRARCHLEHRCRR